MSYILDALRRSDAERERDQTQVPGLFAQQPVGAALRTAEPMSRGLPSWALIVGGVALGVAVPAVWFGVQSPQRPSPVVPAASSDRGVVATEPLPAAPPPVPRTMEAAPKPTPVPQREIAASPPPALPKPQMPPPPAVQTPQARAPELPIARATPAPTASPKAVPASAAATPTAPAERVPKLSELPDSVRREIPGLAFGGAVYSDTPSARFVILNGLIYREQDRIAPDLVVEQIKLKAAVLRWRDQRFEIAF